MSSLMYLSSRDAGVGIPPHCYAAHLANAAHFANGQLLHKGQHRRNIRRDEVLPVRLVAIRAHLQPIVINI